MEPNYAPNVVNQSVDSGGFRWKGNPGSGWTKVGVTGQMGSDNQGYNAQGQMTDPLLISQALQKQQLEANQPAIASLTSQKTNLSDQYSKLLDQIKGGQQAQTQFAEGAANTSLAQRGIDSKSVYGQQQLGSVLTPVNNQYGALEAQLGQGSAQDINDLAKTIAGLQAGNVQGAIAGASSFGNLILQASALPSQIELAQAQSAQARTGANIIPIPGVGAFDLSKGQLVGGITNNNLSTGGFNIMSLK